MSVVVEEGVAIVADGSARTQPSESVDAGEVSRRSSRRHMVAVYNYDARPTPADRQGEVVDTDMYTNVTCSFIRFVLQWVTSSMSRLAPLV